MSSRTSILRALAETLKQIDGTGEFKTDLSNNVVHYLKFWDAMSDFPSCSCSAGFEAREISELHGGYWGFISCEIKLYTKGENSADELELLLDDVEVVINKNLRLEYEPGRFTTDIVINSITTDQGLLAPFSVGEISCTIRYDIHREYT